METSIAEVGEVKMSLKAWKHIQFISEALGSHVPLIATWSETSLFLCCLEHTYVADHIGIWAKSFWSPEIVGDAHELASIH